MIWILKTRPRSGNVHGLNGAAASRAALQAGLIASAAIAGYVTLMPFQHKSGNVIATAEQPQWAGHIEQPNNDTTVLATPVTSASYGVPEASLPGEQLKKIGTANAATPKTSVKLVLPPRRPVIQDISPAAALPVAAPAETVSPSLIPPEMIPLAGEAKPQPRNLLSRAADRLPAKGALLTPFNAVGNAVHNLFKSF